MNIQDIQHEQFSGRTREISARFEAEREMPVRSLKEYREEENVIIGRAVRSEWSGLFLVALFFLLSNMVIFAYPATLYPVYFGMLGSMPLGLVLPLPCIVPLIMLGSVVSRVFDERYVLGPDSLVIVRGLSRFAMKTVEVFYDNVVAVSIDQTPMERILNVGTVTVRLPGDGLAELSLKGVRNPGQYKAMIERRLSIMH